MTTSATEESLLRSGMRSACLCLVMMWSSVASADTINDGKLHLYFDPPAGWSRTNRGSEAVLESPSRHVKVTMSWLYAFGSQLVRRQLQMAGTRRGYACRTTKLTDTSGEVRCANRAGAKTLTAMFRFKKGKSSYSYALVEVNIDRRAGSAEAAAALKLVSSLRPMVTDPAGRGRPTASDTARRRRLYRGMRRRSERFKKDHQTVSGPLLATHTRIRGWQKRPGEGRLAVARRIGAELGPNLRKLAGGSMRTSEDGGILAQAVRKRGKTIHVRTITVDARQGTVWVRDVHFCHRSDARPAVPNVWRCMFWDYRYQRGKLYDTQRTLLKR